MSVCILYYALYQVWKGSLYFLDVVNNYKLTTVFLKVWKVVVWKKVYSSYFLVEAEYTFMLSVHQIEITFSKLQNVLYLKEETTM